MRGAQSAIVRSCTIERTCTNVCLFVSVLYWLRLFELGTTRFVPPLLGVCLGRFAWRGVYEETQAHSFLPSVVLALICLPTMQATNTLHTGAGHQKFRVDTSRTSIATTRSQSLSAACCETSTKDVESPSSRQAIRPAYQLSSCACECLKFQPSDRSFSLGLGEIIACCLASGQ